MPAQLTSTTEPQAAITVIQDMTKDEAEACCSAINKNESDTRHKLLDLYERNGWRAMGYVNWRACARAKFKGGTSWAYYQLSAAQIERGLIQDPDTEPTLKEYLEEMPESYFREFKDVKSVVEQRAALTLAFSAAKEMGKDGEISAALLRASVETVEEIKDTQGQVDIGNGTMTAATASVLVKHEESVQRAIEAKNNRKAAQAAPAEPPPPTTQPEPQGPPDQNEYEMQLAEVLITSVMGKTVTLNFASARDAKHLLKLFNEGKVHWLLDLQNV